MTGTLRELLHSRQFGFIKSDGKDYFFHRDDFHGHWNDLYADWQNGKEFQLEFDVDTERNRKGPRAKNVRRIGHPNEAV